MKMITIQICWNNGEITYVYVQKTDMKDALEALAYVADSKAAKIKVIK